MYIVYSITCLNLLLIPAHDEHNDMINPTKTL